LPTEHEFKYVISLDFATEFTENKIKEICCEHRFIRQGVICHSAGKSVRIRKTIINGRPKTEWQLTFKLKDSDRTIEIETSIDSRDGKDLWHYCYWTLTKDRYVCEVDELKWEIDFFKKDGNLYFILAEVELAENAPRPSETPYFLREFILYEVPLTDKRFSNKRLWNKKYANKLYSKLLKERTI
jgi:CYTH domain-containing protein